jgi:hypothetical protein
MQGLGPDLEHGLAAFLWDEVCPILWGPLWAMALDIQ